MTNFLDRTNAGPIVVLASVCFYLVATAITFITLADSCEHLKAYEKQSANAAATVLAASVLMRAVYFITPRATSLTMADYAMFATNSIAASANFIMGNFATPIVVDPITGSHQYMIRWCEWTTLAFLMTFVVEGVSAHDVRDPLSLATLMGLSAGCGLVFPFCTNYWVWAFVMCFSFVTYFALFPRLARRRRIYRESVESCSCPNDVSQVVANKVSAHLLTRCSVMWTIITAEYCVVWFAAVYLGDDFAREGRPQWPFVLDALTDVAAKLIYAHVIACAHHHLPLEAERQNVRWIRDAMDIVWTTSRDVILLSELRSDKTARTLASKGLASLIGQQEALRWGAWHVHSINAPGEMSQITDTTGSQITDTTGSQITDSTDTEGSSEDGSSQNGEMRVSSGKAGLAESIDELISRAWVLSSANKDSEMQVVTWQLPVDTEANGDDDHATWKGGRWCEVQITRNARQVDAKGAIDTGAGNSYLVLVVREVTERMRAHDMEKRLVMEIAEKAMLAERISREKDEEANRFTRHEVKNGMLAAMSAFDGLRELHSQGMASGIIKGGEEYDAAFTQRWSEIDAVLKRTLDMVLAQAMARDVVHGAYKPRPEPTQLLDLLSRGEGRTARFAITTKPEPLPVLELDPKLIFHIHRNAMSNAAKYGRRGAPIFTEILHEDNTLTLRVINEPGDNHDRLLALDDPQVLFTKGMRLEGAEDNLSAGDGAWIMAQCAEALGGTCRIQVAETETVFELVCPAPVYVGTEDVLWFVMPPTARAIAVDDTPVQRRILAAMFDLLGMPAERTMVLGDSTEELESFGERVASEVRAHPESRFLVIADENLDVDGGARTVSGSLQLQEALQALSKEDAARVLALVRSANDSDKDRARYVQRCHGVVTKDPLTREGALRAIVPQWMSRFGGKDPSSFDSAVLSRSELVASLRRDISELVARLDKEGTTGAWARTWRLLHQLKGCVQSLPRPGGGPDPKNIVAAIEGVRGLDQAPPNWSLSWSQLRKETLRTANVPDPTPVLGVTITKTVCADHASPSAQAHHEGFSDLANSDAGRYPEGSTCAQEMAEDFYQQLAGHVVLDESKLVSLFGRNGDMNTVMAAVKQLLAQCSKTIEEVEQAIAGAALQRLAGSAHRCKGTTGCLGAFRTHAAAKELSDAAKRLMAEQAESEGSDASTDDVDRSARLTEISARVITLVACLRELIAELEGLEVRCDLSRA
eukprot:CAMPEP_0206033094 /NCGR_PEP_ID=MMETSP1466-20131121/393_1 /ASSEMBLY_ACC=CAM_ASM_001126 /TAXON_ID=44452 /ORGANISM="Pavlova gyrans, Strain CCMP608" /LENGTH=1216 /DNA_ID=CAMNT_0053407257 /DNA_START=46 /DNA_END=3696 /DNA_ORIENTATION=+